MRKRIITMLLCSVFSLSMMAQATRTIKGAVIDKNGNPLPGALVEATGGAENTTVDADGTFSMEVPIWLKSATAKYAGMKDKTMKVKSDDMIFRMSEKNSAWFINAVGSYFESKGKFYKAGIMGGKLAKWGYYGKLTPIVDDDSEITFSIGATKSISSNKSKTFKSYWYFGVGYTSVKRGRHEEDGAIFETGLLFKYKHLTFNIGLGYSDAFCCYDNSEGLFGVGYAF